MSICSDVYIASTLTDTDIFMGNAAASLLVNRLVADCTSVSVSASTLYTCCDIYVYLQQVSTYMYTSQHDRPEDVCMQSAAHTHDSAPTSHCVSVACFAGEQRKAWRGCWG